MWHEPLCIHRVTRETSANLVVNAACGHALASVQHHPNGVRVTESSPVPKNKSGLTRTRKFRRAPEAAVARVVFFLELDSSTLQDRRAEGHLLRRLLGNKAGQLV